MIKVETMKTDKTCRISVTGHAGYAPKGSDIVCAGVSTLVYTLIDALSRTKAEHTYTMKDKSPDVDITVDLTGVDGNSKAYIDMFNAGIELISNAYPDYITVQTR